MLENKTFPVPVRNYKREKKVYQTGLNNTLRLELVKTMMLRHFK